MKTLASLLIASLFTIAVSAQNQIDLKYNLELNKTYKAKSTLVQNTTQTIQGNQQAVQTSNTSVFSLKPLKKLETELIAEIRFDTIITILSMPPMEINSSLQGDLKSSDPSKIMDCFMNRLSNSTFLVKMADNGKINEILNFDQVSSGVLQGIDSIQGQMAEMIKMQVKMIINKESVKSMIELVTACLPGKSIQTGEKWSTENEMVSGGVSMIIKNTYKFNSIEANKAIIECESIIESSGKTMEMNGAKITPNIRGIGKSELSIDIASGWTIKATSKQQLKGDLNINAPGMSTQIPLEINSDSETVTIQ